MRSQFPSLSLRTTYSAPQLTARSIRPFTLIITNYFLCTFSRFPSFFFAHVLPYVKSYKHKHSLPSIYLVFYVRRLHISCLDPVQNIQLSVGHRDGEVHSAPKKMYFSHTHRSTHRYHLVTHTFIYAHTNTQQLYSSPQFKSSGNTHLHSQNMRTCTLMFSWFQLQWIHSVLRPFICAFLE